ncbi:DNA cytosine methyltransferase [Tunturibacter empetritectus]|uniref:Cytosine-specific methyltransferase n=1 Tax=Tunturiibacter empetritectus TaxID=3069691 RepID=A0A7W8MSR2_9BACT|nr:DNA cytosine methyltransferase [Edaphobacter lichenicola]MBB5317444.1 DNA (cytosine-5)-methyltransferase 1 [Edaphobacter lichenicola]
MKTSLAILEERNEYLDYLDSIAIPSRGNGLGYVSVFCGGGGLDLGFASAGFKPLFSSDLIPAYCNTVHENLGKHIVEPHDISELSGKTVTDRLGVAVDMVIGGPPCQSFSILGSRKSTDDPRGQLVYEYARFIREIKPKAFLFENVPGILTINKGKDWKEMLSVFEQETGYHLISTKLNAVWFGVPQYRQRIILLGFRRKLDRDRFQWPKRTHSESFEQPELGLLLPRKSELAFEDLVDLPNHIIREHCDRVASRYSQIPCGGRDRKDHTDRIHPERPSGTVLVGSGAGGGRPFIHPFEHRHITVREAARLQSFPDWWEFSGGPTAAYRQVGNAVPPIMARAVAKEIAKAIQG